MGVKYIFTIYSVNFICNFVEYILRPYNNDYTYRKYAYKYGKRVIDGTYRHLNILLLFCNFTEHHWFIDPEQSKLYFHCAKKNTAFLHIMAEMVAVVDAEPINFTELSLIGY